MKVLSDLRLPTPFIPSEGDVYEIRVQLRDQSVRGQWFEREFIWHAHLKLKKVNAASLPADGVTPKDPDAEQSPVPLS